MYPIKIVWIFLAVLLIASTCIAAKKKGKNLKKIKTHKYKPFKSLSSKPFPKLQARSSLKNESKENEEEPLWKKALLKKQNKELTSESESGSGSGAAEIEDLSGSGIDEDDLTKTFFKDDQNNHQRRGLLRDALQNANISIDNSVHSYTAEKSLADRRSNLTVENSVRSVATFKRTEQKNVHKSSPVHDAKKSSVHHRQKKLAINHKKRGFIGNALRNANISIENSVHSYTVKKKEVPLKKKDLIIMDPFEETAVKRDREPMERRRQRDFHLKGKSATDVAAEIEMNDKNLIPMLSSTSPKELRDDTEDAIKETQTGPGPHFEVGYGKDYNTDKRDDYGRYHDDRDREHDRPPHRYHDERPQRGDQWEQPPQKDTTTKEGHHYERGDGERGYNDSPRGGGGGRYDDDGYRGNGGAREENNDYFRDEPHQRDRDGDRGDERRHDYGYKDADHEKEHQSRDKYDDYPEERHHGDHGYHDDSPDRGDYHDEDHGDHHKNYDDDRDDRDESSRRSHDRDDDKGYHDDEEDDKCSDGDKRHGICGKMGNNEMIDEQQRPQPVDGPLLQQLQQQPNDVDITSQTPVPASLSQSMVQIGMDSNSNTVKFLNDQQQQQQPAETVEQQHTQVQEDTGLARNIPSKNIELVQPNPNVPIAPISDQISQVSANQGTGITPALSSIYGVVPQDTEDGRKPDIGESYITEIPAQNSPPNNLRGPVSPISSFSSDAKDPIEVKEESLQHPGHDEGKAIQIVVPGRVEPPPITEHHAYESNEMPVDMNHVGSPFPERRTNNLMLHQQMDNRLPFPPGYQPYGGKELGEARHHINRMDARMERKPTENERYRYYSNSFHRSYRPSQYKLSRAQVNSGSRRSPKKPNSQSAIASKMSVKHKGSAVPQKLQGVTLGYNKDTHMTTQRMSNGQEIELGNRDYADYYHEHLGDYLRQANYDYKILGLQMSDFGIEQQLARKHKLHKHDNQTVLNETTILQQLRDNSTDLENPTDDEDNDSTFTINNNATLVNTSNNTDNTGNAFNNNSTDDLTESKKKETNISDSQAEIIPKAHVDVSMSEEKGSKNSVKKEHLVLLQEVVPDKKKVTEKDGVRKTVIPRKHKQKHHDHHAD